MKSCLACLTTQNYPRDRYEIIVGDNGSEIARSELEDVIAKRATLVVETRKGAGLARNAAAGYARGEILAFIDSDCLAAPNWLAAGVTRLATSGFVAGDVTIIEPEGRDYSGVEAFEKVFAFNMRSYALDKKFAGSGNLFVRRADFERVGGFKVGMSEDMEWSHRAAASGLELAFEQNALVAHPPRRTWAELTHKWRRVSEELFAIARSRRWGRAVWLARSVAMPLSALVHLPRILSYPGMSPTARFRGAGVLIAIRCWRMVYGMRLMFRAERS